MFSKAADLSTKKDTIMVAFLEILQSFSKAILWNAKVYSSPFLYQAIPSSFWIKLDWNNKVKHNISTAKNRWNAAVLLLFSETFFAKNSVNSREHFSLLV